MTYSDDIDVDDLRAMLTIDEYPAPISAIAHVSHALGHEPLVPGRSIAADSELTTIAAAAAQLYRRH
jgi:hypothetical protein